jgi:hypothetical protein
VGYTLYHGTYVHGDHLYFTYPNGGANGYLITSNYAYNGLEPGCG